MTHNFVAIVYFFVFQDRPERAIYNPAQRAAERKKMMEQKNKGEGDSER